jgi:hypothetical protein
LVSKQPKYILIAPLDWGLGHTTRCIPIISYLLELGHIPIVAGNAVQEAVIRNYFPDITCVMLQGYNIAYTKWNKWLQAGLLWQMPRIISVIKAEHEWLKRLAQERRIDGIISDNRYGLFHQHIPSVIITHQLQVQTGLGSIADKLVQKIHYKYLDRFSATWVADVPGTPNLAGKLAHSPLLPHNAAYIGLLSRFYGRVVNMAYNGVGSLLVLLSGPEPQRSMLSAMLWQQVLAYKGNVIFAEGSTSTVTPSDIPSHIVYHKILANDSLANAIANAGMVICRSGYSSLMDLVALNKKAILIPTPGQTEQEYLGKELHGAGIFYTAKQEGFALDRALAEAKAFPFKPLSAGGYDMHRQVICKWLASI